MWNKLNYMKEIEKMRKKYARNPVVELGIAKPEWLNNEADLLNEIYDDTSVFLRNSKINYGCIIQANTILFDKKDKRDCPATFITTDSDYINSSPEILQSVANEIYQYKNTDIDLVPERLRRIVEYIQDEYERGRFSNQIEFEDGNIANLYVITMMVMRKHIPKGYLTKNIYPLITNFENSNTAMILPKKYWTFKVRKY